MPDHGAYLRGAHYRAFLQACHAIVRRTAVLGLAMQLIDVHHHVIKQQRDPLDRRGMVRPYPPQA